MYRESLCKAAAAALLAMPALAQAGNEAIFVATSQAGTTDPYFCVESATGITVDAGGNDFTNNIQNAVWVDQGRNIYAAQWFSGRICRGEWDGSEVAWSTFSPASGEYTGVQYDENRKLLWAWNFTGGVFTCLDADPDSVTYGTEVYPPIVLGGTRERWGMSRSGNRIIIPQAFLGAMEVLDVDPGSATFGQTIVSSNSPGAGQLQFAATVDATISTDDRYAMLLYVGIGGQGLAVYDMLTSSWLDFDPLPGIQDIDLPLGSPNKMDLSIDGSFAVVSGQASGGWVVRVDFDYTTPSNTFVTELAGTESLPECSGAALSPDETRVAVTSEINSSTGELTVIDVYTGLVVSSTVLPAATNLYTVAWQDASPAGTYVEYGTGCAGTLGEPTLSAAPGSRPAIDSTFMLSIGNLPFGLAAVTTGLSSVVTSTGIPLPVDLAIIGMPGCPLLADNLVMDLVLGAGTTATWSWVLPNDPTLFGKTFFNQAFSFDPTANAFGFTASNAGMGTIGF